MPKYSPLGPSSAKRFVARFELHEETEQRMCQTMSMSEKSKNMRTRRVLDAAAWSRTDCERRMRDHLSARAEMSALSQVNRLLGPSRLFPRRKLYRFKMKVRIPTVESNFWWSFIKASIRRTRSVDNSKALAQVLEMFVPIFPFQGLLQITPCKTKPLPVVEPGDKIRIPLRHRLRQVGICVLEDRC